MLLLVYELFDCNEVSKINNYWTTIPTAITTEVIMNLKYNM